MLGLKNQITFLVLVLINAVGIPQEVENDYQTRAYAELSFKPVNVIKLSLNPELRFNENFFLDKYLIDSKVSYKPFNFLSMGAAYRFIGNIRENKATEYLHRFGLSATTRKKIGRFMPAIRLSYTNYADDDQSDKTFLRYKASLKYNIPKCKLTPYLSAELFHQLDKNNLYKVRYGYGIQYKLMKNNYLQAGYKFDYFMQEYKNRHILDLGFKIKF